MNSNTIADALNRETARAIHEHRDGCLHDRAAYLAAQLPPRAVRHWQPRDNGDTIAGWMVGLYRPHNLVLQTTHGDWAVSLDDSVLRERLAQLRPEAGDLIAIRYHRFTEEIWVTSLSSAGK